MRKWQNGWSSGALPSVSMPYHGLMAWAFLVLLRQLTQSDRKKALLIHIMLSAQESTYCSVVRKPNPALSILEERLGLLCFFSPARCLGLMNLPFACLHPSLSLAVIHVWQAELERQKKNPHTHRPRRPYEVTVSTDKVMANVESLQKDRVALCRKQPDILLSFGLPLRRTDATVGPVLVHLCVWECVYLFAIGQECGRCPSLSCPWNVSLTAN